MFGCLQSVGARASIDVNAGGGNMDNEGSNGSEVVGSSSIGGRGELAAVGTEEMWDANSLTLLGVIIGVGATVAAVVVAAWFDGSKAAAFWFAGMVFVVLVVALLVRRPVIRAMRRLYGQAGRQRG